MYLLSQELKAMDIFLMFAICINIQKDKISLVDRIVSICNILEYHRIQFKASFFLYLTLQYYVKNGILFVQTGVFRVRPLFHLFKMIQKIYKNS